jgi:hypothetical protein
MGFKIAEIPIVFFERRGGISKMNKFRTILDVFCMIWSLKFRRD